MAEKTLDRTRHFGVIYGQVENGAVYHQDGIYFRGDGTAIDVPDIDDSGEAEEQNSAPVEPVKPATKPKAAAKQKAAKAEDAPAPAADLPPDDISFELPPVDTDVAPAADSADDLV